MAKAPLPDSFRTALSEQRTSPLWDFLHGLVPVGRPGAQTQATLWRYEAIRPLAMQAADLVPIELAERRVLVLSDPGRGKEAMQATGMIYAGIQVLLPGEIAPTHRHSPSAARIVIEGEGGYTVVNGEKCAMEKGDLILTPHGQWHDHGHEGQTPVLWLDLLDLPIFLAAEASYAEPGTSGCNGEDPLVRLGADLRAKGLDLPARYVKPRPYPKLRYPWTETRKGLDRLAGIAEDDGLLELRYVNPETGEDCLPTLAFTAMMLKPGRRYAPTPRSVGAVYHVVEGEGRVTIDSAAFEWKTNDTFSASTFAEIEFDSSDSGGPAYLIRIDDEPLQRKLAFYSEGAR
ncbi:MAG TPA: cupin domain-containing protein [Alphaproteobacteria bacterium]|nr:cupin domain-containing protein [Alphaproteobacteria bacterium]